MEMGNEVGAAMHAARGEINARNAPLDPAAWPEEPPPRRTPLVVYTRYCTRERTLLNEGVPDQFLG